MHLVSTFAIFVYCGVVTSKPCQTIESVNDPVKEHNFTATCNGFSWEDYRFHYWKDECARAMKKVGANPDKIYSSEMYVFSRESSANKLN